MNVRERYEKKESQYLSEYAVLTLNSKGREKHEEKCQVRTDFQRDRDRILHSKSFRRLAHKTQVFISPEGDHYRTRLTHTLEVSQIARTIARGLSLNEDLTEAISLGHDLGHTPFGHAGEHALQDVTNGKFEHNIHSLRVVEYLENNGKGLNLTFEVKDGILNHQTKGAPSTLEGKIVQFADKIAYINHDIDDAIRGNVLTVEELPKESIEILGETFGVRINTLTMDIISNSTGKNAVLMSEKVFKAYQTLRMFLFNKVYIGSNAKLEENKAKHIVRQLYLYYMDNVDLLISILPQNYKNREDTGQIVCDYIAGMTDRYAINLYCKLFLPTSWDVF